MKHTLDADSIQLAFGNRKILSDIYVHCETGKVTGILGRNGQGKSCLLKIIYGTLNATDKSVRFDNKSIFNMYKHPEIIRYLPQNNFIPQSFTVKKIFKDFDLDFSGFQNTFPESSVKYHSKINSLSGGLLRLLEVYIILKSSTQFVLLDEPFSHIMPLHIEKIKNLMLEEKLKKGLFITDHLYQHITDVSDSLYVLKDGKAWLARSIDDLEHYGYLRNNPFLDNG
jgi:ABC-type lipopolysaccharide export system ATPase subunit